MIFPVSLHCPAAGLLPSPAFRAKAQGARQSATPSSFVGREVSGQFCCPAPHTKHQDERQCQNGSLGLFSALGQIGSLQGIEASSEKATDTPSDNTFSSRDLLPPLLTKQPGIQGAPSLQRTAYLGTPLVMGNSPPLTVAQSISSCSIQFFFVLIQKQSSAVSSLGHNAKPAAPSGAMRHQIILLSRYQKSECSKSCLGRNSGDPTVHGTPL